MAQFAVLCEPNVVVLLDENLKQVWRWEWKQGRLIGLVREDRGNTLTLMEQGGRQWIQLLLSTKQVERYVSADESYPFDSIIPFTTQSEESCFAGMVASSQQLRLIALREKKVHVSGPFGIGFIPHQMCSLRDGRRILFTSHTSSTMKILDIATGEITHTIPAGALVADTGISVDNRLLYACSAMENSLRMWNLNSLHVPSRLIHTGEGPDQIVTSRDYPEQLLIHCADDSALEIRGMVDGQIRKRITLEGAMRHSSIRIHSWVNNYILLSGVNKDPYIAWWNIDSETISVITLLPGKPLRVVALNGK
ncbi:WD40 repeat domain-containing protein [Paenibacillus sp. SC116]|uniref:WD40 repeat domain-containing protein n=1 Tax=Paenibacillus sp. SC116 TaxID=2968986 RepID=UPI00215A6073|nr:WD40 repeat domain-containing protein [Paenibacillus sp. SC116]